MRRWAEHQATLKREPVQFTDALAMTAIFTELASTACNTGARVSELTALRVRDVLLDRQTAVHLHG